MFITTVTFVGCGTWNAFQLNYVSVSNQECKVRPAIIYINSNEPLFYSYNIAVNKSIGSCNDIDNPYVRLCIPEVVKDMNIREFNLMSRINGTRHLTWHETCECKCWGDDKCRCECKELIEKGRCDDGFIWNPSVYECENI